MQEILDAIQSDASPEDFANLAIPESYRAAHVLRSEQTMWDGYESADKDPVSYTHLDVYKRQHPRGRVAGRPCAGGG